jgi:hypothetical protein
MCDPSVHTSSPAPETHLRCSRPIVPIVPNTYDFCCVLDRKETVIGRPYDLWRRPS